MDPIGSLYDSFNIHLQYVSVVGLLRFHDQNCSCRSYPVCAMLTGRDSPLLESDVPSTAQGHLGERQTDRQRQRQTDR